MDIYKYIYIYTIYMHLTQGCGFTILVFYCAVLHHVKGSPLHVAAYSCFNGLCRASHKGSALYSCL